MTNKFVYPVILNYEKDKSGYDYFVSIPDFEGFTQGKDVADAISMARDYIGNMLIEFEKEGKPFPESNATKYDLKENDMETLVDIDLTRFKAQSKNVVVKKTLSIPKYLNELGNEAGINFSATLTEALKEKLGV
ncbi:type II toxin-antitoxin system HicB family antitoxin [Enterococcus sp. BWB1-3]|uniref:type II toxin-antitoxin system HicB family antitoxin n=1 Tax=unclassified Enterococcus TaxID=2608891 RepID=UPI001920DB3D|nr:MULTISPECIES: type II toxin-antitoxin system HicB family antitoxin [unclassified Enterococcus]MBL1228084.1 type II toxin-antitoxin system HicB family antitoxin [Enterococcus sp. BWB1-3]MCB5951909.1 type II toxin-antitoxin system HicB family antitoxin [Enterococcus sp. BWT-B8]MCB5954105.1 type II toxin-antitoxin system HicB family antitoxin [Enterococcus sp. CWB-B31]